MLIVVRHGQTEANARGLLLGRADPPLTDLGRRQARALGEALGGVRRVVSSPLQRARETAAALGVPVEVDERWVEMDYGSLDGLPAGSVPAEVWDRWRGDPELSPGDGESLADVGRRVRPACEELAAVAADEDVVVVTHVSPIKMAVAWALAVDDRTAWRLFVQDAAVCRITIGANGPLLVAFNERHPAYPGPPPSGDG